MDVDLTEMPMGQTYEDRYQGYMDIFKRIAMTPAQERVHVIAPPWSWVPLLRHLHCDLTLPQFFFDHCRVVKGALLGDPGCFDRTLVEVLCNFRPETADALWKCDMQWLPRRVTTYIPVREFIVTTNGAFHRAEVMEFIGKLGLYKPTKRKVVLVPCAADKPYPSPLHKAILDMLPSDFYLMNATGVLGLVPQDMWSEMPHYDSGIPNRWRLMEQVRQYFTRNEHDRVIVYCDFYSEAIREGFAGIGQYDLPEFVLPVKFYYDYVDLMAPSYMNALRRALHPEYFPGNHQAGVGG